MTALTASKARTMQTRTAARYPVAAAAKLFQGSFLSHEATPGGGCVALTAGDEFLGIAEADADNTASGAVDGDKTVVAATSGVLLGVTVTGATAFSNIGTAVYAEDDDALTLTSTSNSLVGRIDSFDPGTTTFGVAFEPVGQRT